MQNAHTKKGTKLNKHQYPADVLYQTFPFEEQEQGTHVSVGEVPVWPLSVRRHLPHDHAVAPHVTGGRELPEGDRLRGRPADRDLSALSGNDADQAG